MLLLPVAILSVVLSAGRDHARVPPVRHATAFVRATQVQGSRMQIARVHKRTHLLYVQCIAVLLSLASYVQKADVCT